jgi:hypothetical protein
MAVPERLLGRRQSGKQSLADDVFLALRVDFSEPGACTVEPISPPLHADSSSNPAAAANLAFMS